MFVYALADDSVERLEVRRTDGRGETLSTTEWAGIGPQRLFAVALHTPETTLPVTGDGRPVPPDVELTALDSSGKIVDRNSLDQR
jgi:hypothetical protein